MSMAKAKTLSYSLQMKVRQSQNRFLIFIILNMVLVSNSVFHIPSASSAQEVCFSNLPDAAWEKGEPQDLNRQGLSSRFSLNAPSTFLYRYQNVPIQLRYEYLGTNCSLRTVNVNYVYSPVFQELNIEKFTEVYKNSAKDLFSIEERIAALKTSINLVNGSQLSLLGDNNLRGTLEWNADSRKIVDSLFKIMMLGFPDSNFSVVVRPVLELDKSCGSSENISDDKNFAKLIRREFLGPATFNAAQESTPPVVFQLTKETCKARVSLIFGEGPKRGESSPLRIQDFENPLITVLIGEVTIVSKVANKKTTITCVKGKLTKKVTAVNPKCPTGYKKK